MILDHETNNVSLLVLPGHLRLLWTQDQVQNVGRHCNVSKTGNCPMQGTKSRIKPPV
jgi:hypothetical protein